MSQLATWDRTESHCATCIACMDCIVHAYKVGMNIEVPLKASYASLARFETCPWMRAGRERGAGNAQRVAGLRHADSRAVCCRSLLK